MKKEEEKEMEMVMEQGGVNELEGQDLRSVLERMSAAAGLLERAVEELRAKPVTQLSAEAEASIERIVASAEAKREAELERKLEFVEAQLEALRASRAFSVEAGARPGGPSGRRTLPGSMATLLAKQGVSAEAVEAGAREGGLGGGLGGGLDRALSSLSIEQRIAVKAELLRSGLIG